MNKTNYEIDRNMAFSALFNVSKINTCNTVIRGVFLLIIFLILFLSNTQHSYAQGFQGTSPEINAVLLQATAYMNNSNYDSAQYILSGAFAQSQYQLTKTDLYYLHCYESEVMYYNALFEQGLNSAIRGSAIATELSDKALLGNTENLIGLFLMNLNRNDEALPHFKTAAKLISPYHENKWLSFQYHALGNIGECFLKLNSPDSAIYYSTLSIEEAQRRGRSRGTALAKWNIAEAMLLQNNLKGSKEEAASGLYSVLSSPHHDVIQSLCGTLMKISYAVGDVDSVYYWMEMGLAENSNSLNTDLSRIQFLQLGIDQCINLNDVPRGNALLKKLNQLERQVSSKQQSQRLNILKDYYEKNQKLILADELNSAQIKELSLRKTVALVFGILVLLLIIIIIIAFQIFKQRHRIAQFKYNERLQNAQNEIELKSLKERMEAISEERNRIASDLHDDVGASLSSINIYSRVAIEKIGQSPEVIPEMLSQISYNASTMMESLSDIVWSINPKNDSLLSLMNRIKIYGLEALQPLDIELYFDNDTSIDVQISMTARKNIYLISKEAISNIAKHSQAKIVRITMTVQNGQLMLVFQDDGLGMNQNETPVGNGLGNIQQRTKELRGELKVDSTISAGTKIEAVFNIANISDIPIQ